MTDLLSTIQQIRSAAGQPNVNPILAAAMQANTDIAVSGENARAAEKQSAADQKMSFVVKGDRISVKNMPTTDFVRSAQESGSRKVAEVSQLIQPAADAARVHQMVKSYGINTPDPNDPELLNGIQGYLESYRAARETDHNPIMSAILGAANAAHLTSQRQSAETLQTQRSTNDLVMADKLILPQEELATRQKTQQRLEAQQAEADRRRSEATARQLINGTDASTYPDEQSMLADIAKQSGVDQLNAALTARAVQKRKQDVTKNANIKFTELRGQNKSNLSPDLLKSLATNYMGTEPSDAQFKILQADQQGEVQAKVDRQAASDRADERLDRYLTGPPEKPHKLNSWEATNTSIDQLVKMRDNPSIDQPALQRAVSVRIGELEKEYHAIYAQSLANSTAYGKLKAYSGSELGAVDMAARRRMAEQQAIGTGLAQRSKEIEIELGKLRGSTPAAASGKVLTKEEALKAMGK